MTRRGDVVVEGHPVGRVRGFSFIPDPAAEGDEKRLVLRAARRALREEMPRRVALVEAAGDSAFALADDQSVIWDGVPIARLKRGTSPLRPRVQVLDSEFLDGSQRERLRIRLQRFLDDKVKLDLAPLRAAADRGSDHPGFRGLLHRLTEALGLIVSDEGDNLTPQSRAALKAIGVKAGRFGLFLPALLKPRAAAMRARLWGLQHDQQGALAAGSRSRLAAAAAGLAGRTLPTRWAGWRSDQCSCGLMSPSGWPRNWRGQPGVVPRHCRPASHRGSP